MSSWALLHVGKKLRIRIDKRFLQPRKNISIRIKNFLFVGAPLADACRLAPPLAVVRISPQSACPLPHIFSPNRFGSSFHLPDSRSCRELFWQTPHINSYKQGAHVMSCVSSFGVSRSTQYLEPETRNRAQACPMRLFKQPVRAGSCR